MQRDRRPHHFGGALGEPALEQEPARVVGAVELESLFLLGERGQEAGVVEHRGDVKQLGIGLQAQPARVQGGEEKTRRE